VVNLIGYITNIIISFKRGGRMNRYLELSSGFIFIVLGAYGIWYFKDQVITVIEGCIGISVFLVGLILLLAGIYEI